MTRPTRPADLPHRTIARPSAAGTPPPLPPASAHFRPPQVHAAFRRAATKAGEFAAAAGVTSHAPPQSRRTPRPRLPRRTTVLGCASAAAGASAHVHAAQGRTSLRATAGVRSPEPTARRAPPAARTGQVPRSPRARDTCRHRTPRFERLIRRLRRSCRHRPAIRSKAIRSLMTSLRRHRVRPRPGAGRRRQQAAGRGQPHQDPPGSRPGPRRPWHRSAGGHRHAAEPDALQPR